MSTTSNQRLLSHPWFALPEKDARNRWHRSNYKPVLEAGKDNTLGTAGTLVGRKCQRIHEYLSYIEICLHYLLECNPLVIDYREQYPFYHNDEMAVLVDRCGGRVPRNKVPSYDFVVTYLRELGTDEFCYQAISVKLEKETKTAKFARRRLREIDDCSVYGWNWRVFTELHVNPVQVNNCIHIVEATRYTNIYAQAADALDYSTELRRLRRVNSFEAELRRMAVRTGCNVEQSLALFSTGVMLGFIPFDFRREWSMKRPLAMKV